MSEIPERLMTIKEASTYLHVSPLTVRRMIDRGELTAYTIGPKLVRIDPSDITALMAGGVK